MNRYATGARPDPAGYRRTPLRHLLARTRAQIPDALSLEAHAPPVFDQGPTGSCVGHAFACAITTSLDIAGTPLGWVCSPGNIYTLARAIDRTPAPDGTLPPLEDVGSAPNEAERGVREWGVRPCRGPTPDGRNSDVDPTNVNTEPSLVDLELDAATLIVGAYGIYSTGDARGADVRAALAGGYPVTVSVPGGSDAWQNYTGGGVIGPTGQPLDHEVCIIGYEQGADGWVFRIRNSWGAGYGMAGDVLVSQGALDEFADLIAWSIERTS